MAARLQHSGACSHKEQGPLEAQGTQKLGSSSIWHIYPTVVAPPDGGIPKMAKRPTTQVAQVSISITTVMSPLRLKATPEA